MKRRIQTAFLALVMLVALSACSLLPFGGAQLTPEQRYAEAVVTFKAIYESYLDEYDLATPEIQAEWKAKIDPRMADASLALRTWGTALRDGLSLEVKEQLFIHLKNIAWKILFDSGVVKVGG